MASDERASDVEREERYKLKGKRMTSSGVQVFFRYFLQLFLIAAVLFVVVIGVIWGVNSYRSGNLEVFTDKVVNDVGENVDTEGIFGQIKNLWDDIRDPTRMQTYKSVVEDNEENRRLGVKILSFYTDRSSEYFENDDIRGVAAVQAASLSDNWSMIKFDCELEDYHGQKSVLPSDMVYFGNGFEEKANVGCTFQGDKIALDSQTLNSKKLTFTATFDAFVISHYDVYIMEREEYERITVDLKKNPFDYYNIHEPNLGIGNSMRSTTTPGPVNLAIGTENSQPFTHWSNDESETWFVDEFPELYDPDPIHQERNYYFQVAMSSNFGETDGSIKSVKSLILKVPKEVQLIEDRRNCDFVSTGQSEGGYDLYTLTDYAFAEKVNKDCSVEALNGTGITENSCMKDFKNRGIQLQCFFRIPEYPQEWGNFVVTSFVAELDYVYEKHKTEYVVIRRMPDAEERGDPCGNYTLEDCKTDMGCKPILNGNVFETCLSCTENYCSDYETQEECETNYCLSNTCYWDVDACTVSLVD